MTTIGLAETIQTFCSAQRQLPSSKNIKHATNHLLSLDIAALEESKPSLSGVDESECSDALSFILKPVVHYFIDLHRESLEEEKERGDVRSDNWNESFQNLSLEENTKYFIDRLVKGGVNALIRCLYLTQVILAQYNDERVTGSFILSTHRDEFVYILLRLATAPGIIERIQGSKDNFVIGKCFAFLKKVESNPTRQESMYVKLLTPRLHHLLGRSLEKEEKAYDSNEVLKKHGLAFTSRALLLLVRKMKEICEQCFTLILSLTFGLTNSVILHQRLDGLAVLGHMISNCDIGIVKGNGDAIVTAVKESLKWRDAQTTTSACSLLSRVMEIVEPIDSLGLLKKPSTSWREVFERALKAFHTLAEASDNESIIAATGVAHSIVAMAKYQLLPYLRAFVPIICLLLGRTALLTSSHSTSPYKLACKAVTDAARWTWPRIPAHYEQLTISMARAVSEVYRVCEDDNNKTTVVLVSAETLLQVRRCGEGSSFDALVETVLKHPQLDSYLKPVQELFRIVHGRAHQAQFPEGRPVLKSSGPARIAYPQGWLRDERCN